MTGGDGSHNWNVANNYGIVPHTGSNAAGAGSVIVTSPCVACSALGRADARSDVLSQVTNAETGRCASRRLMVRPFDTRAGYTVRPRLDVTSSHP